MKVSVIFWDFDGVILCSNDVREAGFAEVLRKFPEEQVSQLLVFHRENGGLSRYVKFRYFFEDIRKENITEADLDCYADAFSQIMKRELVNPDLLIETTNRFIKENSDSYNMHIVSGSDQAELRFLCDILGISGYFRSIHGSPTPKIKLVERVMKKHQYDTARCVLIGDSINDFEAAKRNGIGFQCFGNDQLSEFSSHSLDL